MKIKPNKPNPLFSILVKPRVASRWKSMSRTQLSEVERMKWDKKWHSVKCQIAYWEEEMKGKTRTTELSTEAGYRKWGKFTLWIQSISRKYKPQHQPMEHPHLTVTADCSLTALTAVCSTSFPSSPLWLGLSECCRVWCTLQEVMHGLCRRQGKKSGVLKSLQLTLS